jgi:hypothetical protein
MKIFIPFYLCIVASMAFADTYEIFYQKGKVEITRDGIAVGPPVRPGDQVKVEKGGVVVLKSPQEVIKLMGDTILTPRQTKNGTLIELVRGSVVSKVTKKTFEVISNKTSFGVRGTQFFVQATGADNVWMCVQEGVVNVIKNEKNVDVPAGKGVFVGASEISKPQAYSWTKGINWKMDERDGDLDHKIELKYDLLENFYD